MDGTDGHAESCGGAGTQSRRGPRVFRRMVHSLGRLFHRYGLSGQTALLVLALVVGVASGWGAVGFRWLINQCSDFFFNGLGDALGFLGPYRVIVLPALGLLLVAPIVGRLAPEIRGSGVPAVMEALATREGLIRARVVVLKALATATCIGSGGSVGREGPIVHLGAACGSVVGRFLHLSPARVRTLVACGAAGGVAATFNAPLAAVFFSLEVLSGEFAPESFGAVVAASFGGSVVGRYALGDFPAFDVPRYQVARMADLPLFALLGAASALVGQLFMAALYRVEDMADSAPGPSWLKTLVGGLTVGVLGCVAPQIFGVGYETTSDAVWGSMARRGLFAPESSGPASWSLLSDVHWQYAVAAAATLVVLKVLATSTTMAAGASGGVFAPALFLGAVSGAAFGGLAHAYGAETHPGAFAIVGMAAVFSAVAHAPMSSMLIVFELTGDYRLILPLMFACVVAVVLSRRMDRDSIYTKRLTRRGVHVSLSRDIALLNTISVEDAMVRDTISVPPHRKVSEVVALFEETKHHGFPLVDEQGFLHGIVSLHDVRRALHEGLRDVAVSEIATHQVVVCFPYETLNDALRKLGLRDVGRLPVVDPDDHRVLLGLITRKNIIAAYNRALMRQHERLDETEDTETYE